jgi:predicted CopG family antitoxin
MASDSARTTLSISHETWLKLSKLRRVNQSYDSLISEIADQALMVSDNDDDWDVDKIITDLKKIDKQTRYHSIDEVFSDV